jgi:hypothetical protein
MSWRNGRPREERAPEHERAQFLASERLNGTLDDDRARWLDAHLAGCPSCTRVALDYAAQSALLRALPMPPPPRDLWARTAAAIEAEAGPRPLRSGGGRRRARVPALSLGILSGALVVAVVVTASLLATPTVQPQPSIPVTALSSPSPAASPTGPVATPIAVAMKVNWVITDDDGTVTWFGGNVDEVCPTEAEPDCAPIEGQEGQVLNLTQPLHSVIQSPSQGQIVVTSKNGVFVVPVETPTPSVEPSLASSPSQPPSPSPSETPGTSASPSPSQSPTPPPSPTPASPFPTATAEPSSDPSSEPSPSPTVEPSGSPTPSPSASAAAALAILSDVVVVGETAAYSPDGLWFAFTARPVNDSQGPDIYVWNPSLPQATAVTTDHRSVFSSWVGNRIVGSTAVAVGPDLAASSFLLDPATGEIAESQDPTLWRPVVDPEERWAFGWQGSLASDGLTIEARDGQLVIVDWSRPGGGPNREPTVVAQGPIREWDARWDDTGRLLAVWIADASDPSIGRLSLYEVNPGNGRIDQKPPLLLDRPALPGFAIRAGHLAWATPPGEDGAGSKLEVLAWTDDGTGSVVTEDRSGEVIVAR